MTPKELKARYRNERLAAREAIPPDERIEKGLAMLAHAGDAIDL